MQATVVSKSYKFVIQMIVSFVIIVNYSMNIQAFRTKTSISIGDDCINLVVHTLKLVRRHSKLHFYFNNISSNECE